MEREFRFIRNSLFFFIGADLPVSAPEAAVSMKKEFFGVFVG
jgi:hypothetical protein